MNSSPQRVWQFDVAPVADVSLEQQGRQVHPAEVSRLLKWHQFSDSEAVVSLLQ